jgi:excisionase family DNA binding protein
MRNQNKFPCLDSISPPKRFAIQPRLLRIPEAAIYIGATNWFVEELVRANLIPFLTVGKYRVIDVCDLDTWIDEEKKLQFSHLPQTGAV